MSGKARPPRSDGEFERRVRDVLVPRLQDAHVIVSLVPKGEVDVKFATELGLSIMMGKPIIAVIRPGTQVPDKLVRVADRIIECSDEDVRDGHYLADRVKAAMNDIMDAQDDGFDSGSGS